MPLYQEQAAFRAGTALVAELPDSTTAGGNARGANAVDLQTAARGGATQVASGANSVITGGVRNTASGPQSIVAGGNDNTASGTTSTISGGAGNTAAGLYSWVPGGFQATTRDAIGRGAWSSGQVSTLGDAQAGEFVLRRQTTDATPTRLTADNAAAGSANTVNLPNNSAYRATVLVVGRQNTAGGGRLSIRQDVLIVRDADAASTTVTAGTAETLSTGTVAGWAVALAADTTNGGLSIMVTGAAATTINWVARVMSVEVVA